MKKIQQVELSSTIDLKCNQNLNPEQNQTKCKICLEQTKPLVTLCQCTGSIAYVHQDCILDWIALKMEKSQFIQIPKCQICKATFSATMKIGSKKIDNNLLLDKAKKCNLKNWVYGISFLIGFIFALLTLLVSTFHLLLGYSINFNSTGQIFFSTLKTFFIDFIFPFVFMDNFIKYLKGKWKIIQDCKVQLVQVTLLPKKILKA